MDFIECNAYINKTHNLKKITMKHMFSFVEEDKKKYECIFIFAA